MSKLLDNDYINQLETALVSYISSKLTDGYDCDISAGYPSFVGKLPLEKVHITVYCEGSDIKSSGYDETISTDDGIKVRSKIIDAEVAIDVWSSKGSAINNSKAGGKTGCQRYFSALMHLFNIEDELFYEAYPDAEIEEFRQQYSSEPKSIDDPDLFQTHGQMRISFPVEISVDRTVVLDRLDYPMFSIVDAKVQISYPYGSTCYYTIDETYPTISSLLYTEPIAIFDTITIKAFCVKEGMLDSYVSKVVYTFNEVLSGFVTYYPAFRLSS